jgi:nudix-type nucleoside diphosphatase (YffH/AdpP family)
MIVSRRTKYKGFFTIDELSVKTKSGKEVKREVMVRRDAVASVVYDTVRKKFIFVSQWRPGSNGYLTELVAGTMDKDSECPEDTMLREIDEEIGYEVDKIEFIAESYMSPGGSTEVIFIYYCEVSNKIHQGGGLESENEEIDVIEFDLDQVISGKFFDAKTQIGINYVKENANRFK